MLLGVRCYFSGQFALHLQSFKERYEISHDPYHQCCVYDQGKSSYQCPNAPRLHAFHCTQDYKCWCHAQYDTKHVR